MMYVLCTGCAPHVSHGDGPCVLHGPCPCDVRIPAPVVTVTVTSLDWRYLLGKYGDHLHDCACLTQGAPDCTCGWDDVARKEGL